MLQLRKYRTKANMTQKELAGACGLSELSVCRYEKGERIPNITLAKRMAEALGCSLEDLCEDGNEGGTPQ